MFSLEFLSGFLARYDVKKIAVFCSVIVGIIAVAFTAGFYVNGSSNTAGVSTTIVGTQTITAGVNGPTVTTTQTNVLVIQPAITLTTITSTGATTTQTITVSYNTTITTTCTIGVNCP